MNFVEWLSKEVVLMIAGFGFVGDGKVETFFHIKFHLPKGRPFCKFVEIVLKDKMVSFSFDFSVYDTIIRKQSHG